MLTDEQLRRELSAAFHEAADPVVLAAGQPAPSRPAVVAPATLLWQTARRRRGPAVAQRGLALAGPVLAAAAAVTVAVSLASGTGHDAPAGPAQATHGSAGALLAAAVISAPPAAAAAGLPRFYLVADHAEPVAVVRDSATGKAAGTVGLPAGTFPKSTQVTAAGDGRAFVLALGSAAGTRFYQLRVSTSGRPGRLTRLSIPALPADDMADSIALTPDGTRLAVAVQAGGQQGLIEVARLATGAVQAWTTSRSGIPEDLAWDAAGQRLGYFWTGAGAGLDGLWLLDTRAPGRTLLAGHRLLAQTVGPDEVQDALITPSTHTIIASVTYNGTTKVSRGMVVGGIVAVSERTGRPLYTLLAERAAHSSDAGWYVTSCLLPAIDRTGSHLLVSCGRFGRLDHGRFTPLPGAAPQTAVAAAW